VIPRETFDGKTFGSALDAVERFPATDDWRGVHLVDTLADLRLALVRRVNTPLTQETARHFLEGRARRAQARIILHKSDHDPEAFPPFPSA